MIRPLLSLVVVGAVAVGLVLGAEHLPAPSPLGGSADVVRQAAVVPVSGRSVYCPVSGDGRISVGLTRPGPGQVTAGPLDGRAALLPVGADLTLGDAGRGIDGPVAVRATGPAAGGLEVEQVGAPATGGLSGRRCQAAGTTTWFTGGATKVGDTTVLELVNPDRTPTLVDVSVLSRTGPAEVAAGRGLQVPPSSRLTVSINDLAPDRDLLAVKVVATRGRFAASMQLTRRQGRVPYGSEQVPASSGPTPLAVLPGVPRGPGGRELVLTNPGAQTAVAALTLTGVAGQQDPPGLAAVTVPAGTSVAVDLAAYTVDGSLSVSVRSPGVPLLAAVLIDDSEPGRPEHDLAYAAPARPLSGPGLLTDVVLRDGTDATLLLSAPQDAAQVRLTPVPVAGSGTTLPAPLQVRLAAGQTRAVSLAGLLPPGASGRFALRVAPDPGSGPVYAARYLRRTGVAGSTILTLVPAAPEVRSPAVRPDPLTGRT